jgi:arsenate reductase
MRERGIDLSGQASKSVTEYLGTTHFAHTITVCGDAEENCPAVFLNMGKHEHWSFEDPAKFQGSDVEKLEFTRQVRDRMEERILQWLNEQGIYPGPL